MSSRRCPLCGKKELVEDEMLGELVCLSCGFVVDKLVYRGPEWRAYGVGDRLRRERVGAPITPLLHDLGLSTKVSARRELRSQEDKLMIEVLSEIHRISSSMSLPRSVAETAAFLLRRLKPHLGRFRRSLQILPASLLHLALKVHGIPRSPKELTRYAGVESSRILRCSMRVASLLGIRSQQDIGACIAKLVKALKLPGAVEKRASEICTMAMKQGLSQGRSRRALAAASVYLAARTSGFKVSQRLIAKLGQVGLSTLKRRLKELEPLLTINI